MSTPIDTPFIHKLGCQCLECYNALGYIGVISTSKESNPKDAVGIKKVPFWLVPDRVIAKLAVALYEGALKYGAFNYRVAGIRVSVYTSAAERHIKAYKEGRDIDPDSGLHEIDKAIASLVVLRDGLMQGNAVDDRQPKATDGWLEDCNSDVERLAAKYPNPKQPFTEMTLYKDVASVLKDYNKTDNKW